ncbi:MAB_1171c family putative transporter [Saccharothrix syringae]|uniref:DUF6545 domain-containing protein n=1 Tax=Saccharothrix syringae TaxID=103733 RepID=A0A5Q0H280_SACSY|nr:MAB_1171c family putative transporter [Saccharothrix syringae]QFZ20318.1 hypothetical protein EKG83_25445 [Saccharothrix syringae]
MADAGTDLQYAVSAAGVLVLLVHKARAWRQAPPEHRPALLPICLSCVTAIPAFLLLAPTVGTGLDRLTGVPNLSVLVIYALGVVFVATNQAMLLYWRHPPARAWRTTRVVVAVCALVLAAMVVLFALGETPVERHDDFPAAYADTPYIGEMMVLHQGTFLLGLLNVVRLCWLWAPEDQPWLRRGLRINAVGVLVASAYSAMTLVAIFGSWLGADLDSWAVTAPDALTLSMPLVVVGASIAAWGPRLPHLRERLVRVRDARRDHRVLRPLWTALRAVDPAMLHAPGTLRERLSPEHRLFWRVIEINDWLHQLRCHRVPDLRAAVERHAPHLSPAEVDAVTEAARVRSALRARALGTAPADTPVPDQDDPVGAEHAFAGERTRLVLLALAFTSPVVDEVLACTPAPTG